MKKIALLAGLIAAGSLPVAAQNSPITFNARGLVAISDADMAASAFVDGKLLRDNLIKDKLASIKFPLVRGGKSFEDIIVPNSALTYSKSMAVPKTGGLAFVLDARVRPEDNVMEYKDVMAEFPEGNKLYVVDIVNLAAPKVKFAFPVGKNPLAVDVYKNELMVSTSEAGKKLLFLEVDADGKPTRLVPLPVGLDSTRILDLAWHPSGNFVGVTLESKEVAFYKILRKNDKLENIEMVGKPIKAGVSPVSGKFSADGKFYYVVDSKGPIGKATADGELLVVQFAQDGAGEHKITGQTPVGLNPGAFSISPDGKSIVTVNAGNSVQPWTTATPSGSSLTLLKVDDAGGLTKVSDYPFEGLFPQSVAFDKDGSNIAVAVYEYVDYGDRNGGVEFWTVNKSEPSLKKQAGKISLERGCHTIRVIP